MKFVTKGTHFTSMLGTEFNGRFLRVHLGVMKFGSRMDVFLPTDIRVQVKAGDRVVAATTVLGRWTGA